jgi:NDP-sugar pyrophosphorylase family protein
MQTIILAGGKGIRLAPYTTSIPKPLVPVGDHPILEIILKQLRHFGFYDIELAVGHMANIIEAYFQDGSKYGLKIHYNLEDKPLGTAGPLTLIPDLEDNFLVMNSDDLTDLNYRDFFNYHLDHQAGVTIAMYTKKQQISLGVLEVNKQNQLTNYTEKPTFNFQVSMGIYAFKKQALKYIPRSSYFDFPDLIQIMLQNGERVTCYQHDGYWLDIGRPEDYEEANKIIKTLKII